MTEQFLDKKPLALIIEDDKRQSTVFDHALRQAEFETEIIRDGEEALARLAVTIPTVVILDLHLPKVSGRDVLRQIRADPRLEKTRVLLATADPRMAEIIRPESDLVLLKPISFNQLRDLAKRFNPNLMG